MSPSPTDRRVRRTRELLRNAFLSLVLEKGYDRITVQDILDRADVGRSTFYAHFRDKEDLLHAGFEDVHAALAAAREADRQAGAGEVGDEPFGPLVAVFRHVEAHRQLWGAMSHKGGTDVVARILRDSVGDLVQEHLRSRFPTRVGTTELDAAVEFATGACMGLLVWWLDHDEVSWSAEQVQATFRRLAGPGVTSVLSP
jgi:AcrR family transcriptional regulator